MDKDKNNQHSGSDDIEEFFATFDQKAEESAEKKARKKAAAAAGSGTGQKRSAAAASYAEQRRSAATTNPHAENKHSASDHKEKKNNNDKLQSLKESLQSVTEKIPKRNKENKKKKSTARKVLKYAGLSCLGLFAIFVIYVGIVVAQAANSDLKFDYDSLYENLSQRSTIYDDNGKKIENVFAEGGNRDVVAYEDLPKNLKNGIIAIEDKTFWDHKGFNVIRMFGAIKTSIFGGGQIGGTSTISQQLARNIYLPDEKSNRDLSRKIREAYFTVAIERNLTKKQILEAYLNTIYLGFDSYGVEAASRAYFNKSVTKLDLLETAALCAMPQSPDAYALVKTYGYDSTKANPANLLDRNGSMVYIYNGDHEKSKARRELTIKSMVEQDYISKKAARKALKQDLKDHMNISNNNSGMSSYFNDFAIDQITRDLMEELDCDEAHARKMIYTGGLKIHTTLNKKMQKTIEKEFKQNYNFPSLQNIPYDANGNIVNPNNRQVSFYAYKHYFNDNGTFKFKKNEFEFNADGSLTIYKNKRLKIFTVSSGTTKDVNIEFKSMFRFKDYRLHTIENGILSIPAEYKKLDSDGNCKISADFFKAKSNIFKKKGRKLSVSKKGYILKQEVVQPQSAMVIMDAKTGSVKAMVGGRNIEGKRLFNRSMMPRQPGSSIKPLSVYSTALQAGYDAAEKGSSMDLSSTDGSQWGEYITAGSKIKDAPIMYNGKSWPKNAYSGFKGLMSMRSAIEQSSNTVAVKTYQQLEKADPNLPIDQLKKMGVTTIKEDGATSDRTPAAMALGGMTNGISPLEMAGAYAIFPNEGKYTEPNAYTKIISSEGKVLVRKSEYTDQEQVIDRGVAFVMTDLLQSVVKKGTGTGAAISSQPVAGKTGTTSDNYDAWFVGCTPQYTAALWIGNDVNIQLTQGSPAAAKLWGKIMGQVCIGTPYQDFPIMPGNVTKQGGEYYLNDTYTYVPPAVDDSNFFNWKNRDNDSDDEYNDGNDNEDNYNEGDQPGPTEEPDDDSHNDGSWPF